MRFWTCALVQLRSLKTSVSLSSPESPPPQAAATARASIAITAIRTSVNLPGRGMPLCWMSSRCGCMSVSFLNLRLSAPCFPHRSIA